MSAQTFRSEVQTSDADAVERVVRATGVFSTDETAIARELVEASLTQGAEASGYHFLFADGGNGLRGYTCFGPISGTAGRYELYWIAVHPDERRSGLGKLLMQASEDAVRTLGGAFLFAETSTRADYAPARKFYEAAGYLAMGEVADWYADGDGLLIYGKRLTSS